MPASRDTAGPSRRRVLFTAAAAPALAVAAAAFATPAVGAPGTQPALAAFDLSEVRLLDGPFLANMRRTCAYLLFVDTDRLLHTFRRTVGLPSSAEPCGGWEAPGVQLRGHTTGHLLSALAQAHAGTGGSAYADKGRALVSALAECQRAAPAAGFTRGYLSAFPEPVFDQLESGGKPWAPYYTLHKIMAGLLDQYRLSGNQEALDVLLGMAAWVDARTAPLSYERMQTPAQSMGTVAVPDRGPPPTRGETGAPGQGRPVREPRGASIAQVVSSVKRAGSSHVCGPPCWVSQSRASMCRKYSRGFRTPDARDPSERSFAVSTWAG